MTDTPKPDQFVAVREAFERYTLGGWGWRDRLTDATIAAMPALLDAVKRVRECEEVLFDKQRLTRELDVAMHGEDGAAKQASLCDLVGPAKALRARAEAAEAEAKALREAIVQYVEAQPGQETEQAYKRLELLAGRS